LLTLTIYFISYYNKSPIIYSSLRNISLFPPQLDNVSSTVNIVQGTPVVLDSMSTTININQPSQANLNMDPSLQHATYSTQKTIMSKYSFFYAPFNDFQMYYIICEEVPLSFENVSLMIDITDSDSTHNYVQQFSNIYTFYHRQPEIKKIYRVTCEMVSHTFIFQFLNKSFFDIQFIQNEYQQQEFSKRHLENLKFYLKKDLIRYLAPQQTCGQNFDLFKRLILNHYPYETMINFNNNDMLIHPQQYDASALFFNSNSQQDHIQFVGSQNDDDNYNQGYYYDNNLSHF
jgi:hypothetical protein